MVKVQIKWGKEKFDSVELIEDPLEFKMCVYSLTNVPVDKQKLIYKGTVIQNNTNITNLNIPDNGLIMLMGSADGTSKIQQPAEKVVFIEDLSSEQKALILKQKTGIILPAGLVNLGNTCYLNSSLQCLRRVNEINEFFLQNGVKNPQDNQLAFQMQRLFQTLHKKGQEFPPYEFLNIFLNYFPQFAEQQGGVLKQQDADECFQGLLQYTKPALQIKVNIYT